MIERTLLNSLMSSIEGMGITRVQFGFPEMVLKEVHKAESLFKDFAKAKPSTQDAYKAGLAVLNGEQLDDWITDLAAAAVAIPIEEHGGISILESNYCDTLLSKYENAAYSGNLWRLTWYSLFNSYLTYNPTKIATDKGSSGFFKLRRLLNRTWPAVDKQSVGSVVPDWVRTLRDEAHLLSDNPVGKYAQDFFEGKTERIKALAENLGIPAGSWFWQELVLGAVRYVSQATDEYFRSQIVMLIELIKSAPVYRDKALAEILNRYYRCSTRVVHPELRDFVIHTSVWRNPKLKAAGIATSWNQVSEEVWRMVMGWVNERNLKDFFDILAARGHADHGRLRFWSRYMNQISWTRLVFGAETIQQKRNNAGIKALLESETGTYAYLQGGADRELDAFLMQIGNFIFVEFSKTGNGAYGYHVSELAFNLHANTYAGSTSDLKCGYYKDGLGVMKVIHTPGWEERTAFELRRLGINPDREAPRFEPGRSLLSTEQASALERINDLNPGSPSVGSRSIPRFAAMGPSDSTLIQEADQPKFEIGVTWTEKETATQPDIPLPLPFHLVFDGVQRIVAKYQGADATETGSGTTRRIWVRNPRGWVALEDELKRHGFRWASSRQCWYWGSS